MNEIPTRDRAAGLTPRLVTTRRGPVRIAAVHDAAWIEGELIAEPENFVASLRSAPPADILVFARPLPNREPCYPFHFEWDNVAAAKLGEFTQWWEALPQETRKNVRRSQRRGVSVRRVSFDDQLVRGISKIYNETPVRQGRKFWHYGKSLDRVKAENATYLDRGELIGAFFNGELIGFMKFVMVNNLARIMQIVSMEAHMDKRPTNALLAKAVEICCEKRASHLIYGKYVYGKKEHSPLIEFKKRNGFERLDFPCYYVPLTRVGALAIRFGLHRGLAQLMPEKVTNLFLAMRTAFYRRRFRLRGGINAASAGQNLPAGSSSTTV
ncbi:MAG: hypothetical protein ABSG04_03075 [Verrucomicrobiota bacterium]|jgi:hypothetical protein